MNQENRANELDRLLSERLRETPGEFSSAALRRVHRLILRFLNACGRKPDLSAGALRDDALLARLQILPPHIQEALRRYNIFGEAEESICLSMNLPPKEFRRLRLDARNYVLDRQARRKVSWLQS